MLLPAMYDISCKLFERMVKEKFWELKTTNQSQKIYLGNYTG